MKTAGVTLGAGWEKLDPTPGVSRGDSWAEFFRNFSWNLCSWCCWKPLEKKFSHGKKFPGTSWDLKGTCGNPELLFPFVVFFFPKKNVDFDCLKVQKIRFSFVIEGIYSQFQAKIPCSKLLLPSFVLQEVGNSKKIGNYNIGNKF